MEYTTVYYMIFIILLVMSKLWCPFCKKAKEAFSKIGANVDYFELEDEKKKFLDIIAAADPAYQFPDPLIKDSSAHLALANSDLFGKNGVLKNPFKIKNIYLHLSDVLGESYRNFLTLVVAGTAQNPARADGVLVADVPPGIGDIEELQRILSKTKSIEEVVDYYVSDPNINIKFRV